jgi:hypothetical protein
MQLEPKQKEGLMGVNTPLKRRSRAAVVAALLALASAGSAAAFQALPPGAQVNDDPAAGINPALPVNTEDPANADVVGGSLVASKPLVPWAIFRQTTSGNDQVFSRSFAGGAWTTRGNGTVGGSSSASPTFLGSLNFDQGQDGEAPSIDFAGAGRTVPWASWYEHTTGGQFNADNIFASKFDNTGDANQGKWIFAGQGRGLGGSGNVQVPSLNIHTNRDAVNPVVAGGATVAGNDPVPWVTWQEVDGASATDPQQIFTSKGAKPATGTTTCPNDGANPIKPSAGSGANGGFCFQQVGIDRVDSGQGSTDPSQNVDPTRDGVEPDMAFTGANETVPWVVWYEQSNGPNPHPSQVGLRDNEMVFAAKATSNPAADGQFQWTAVGSGGTGVLDTSGTTPAGDKHFGTCATSQTAEEQCSVNHDPTKDAEDPRVAAGTMTAGNPTVPWIVWDEGNAASPNNNDVFVARLVGAGAAARFVIANGGQPVGTGDRSDITFSGNTPYVTWHHNGQVVTGHFTTPDQFVKDGAPVGSNVTDAVRAPISSTCIATPFSTDGSACQAAAVGTPFLLFTAGDSAHAKLFAQAYQPDAPVTGSAIAVTSSAATLNGSVNPEGASVRTSFEFGTTTAYGQATPAQKTGPDSGSDAFSAQLTALPAGTTIHYRALATSDFGTFVGADQTLRTASSTPPSPPGAGAGSAGRAKVSGNTAAVRVTCAGAAGATCRLHLMLRVTETLRGHRLVALAARAKGKTVRKLVTVGGPVNVTLSAGQARTVHVSLNGIGRQLLAKRHTLKATLLVTQSLTNGRTRTVSSQTVTFTAPHKHKHRHKR